MSLINCRMLFELIQTASLYLIRMIDLGSPPHENGDRGQGVSMQGLRKAY